MENHSSVTGHQASRVLKRVWMGGVGGYKCQLSVKFSAFCQLSVKRLLIINRETYLFIFDPKFS